MYFEDVGGYEENPEKGVERSLGYDGYYVLTGLNPEKGVERWGSS